MIIPADRRADRLHNATAADQRTPFQRDRDRILYCSAFRRLSGISQIARAGEADVFHTRLTHTMKVAQLGRRLAELVIEDQPVEALLHGVEVEVVEAACLAHDLGHPPFGHIGEEMLNSILLEKGEQDGYEGNAQTFRILTKLAVRFESFPGLDLTRATLAATIKYPWRRTPGNPLKEKKWGYYGTEAVEFDFARDGSASEMKTAEAELMEWADDIAYSVHDLEDFHRCNLIPWRDVFSREGRDRLIARIEAKSPVAMTNSERVKYRHAHRRLKKLCLGAVGDLIDQPYEATREQRLAIRVMTSSLIGHYIHQIKLRDVADGSLPCAVVDDGAKREIAVLKQICRDHVLEMPTLRAQQKGQGRVLKELFEDIFEQDSEQYLPRRLSFLLDGDESRARRVADCISNMSESEVIALHARLRGRASGSVLDPILR